MRAKITAVLVTTVTVMLAACPRPSDSEEPPDPADETSRGPEEPDEPQV